MELAVVDPGPAPGLLVLVTMCKEAKASTIAKNSVEKLISDISKFTRGRIVVKWF